MPRFIRPQATSEHSINWSLFYSLSENNHYLYLLSDLYDPLNEFLNDRVSRWLNIVQQCTQNMISNQYFQELDLCHNDILDDLCG